MKGADEANNIPAKLMIYQRSLMADFGYHHSQIYLVISLKVKLKDAGQEVRLQP